MEINKKVDIKKWSTIGVLCCGTGIIFQLPYLRNFFYVPVIEALNITNVEFGALSSVYAIVSMICYFWGGWLSERVSPRKLLTFSFLATGCIGMVLAETLDYGTIHILYALLGIPTVLTYWSPLIKVLGDLGNKDEQGKLFGVLEGGRGVVSASLVFIMLGMFNALGGGKFGLAWVIRAYSIISIIVGICLWFLIQNKYDTPAPRTGILRQIPAVLKMPRMWMVFVIIFTVYTIYAILSYLPLYMVSVYGMSDTASVQMGGIRYLVQFAGGVVGILVAGRLGSYLKTVLLGYAALIVFLAVFLYTPGQPALLLMCIFDFILLCITVFAVRGIYFALIHEIGIDEKYIGPATDIASCVGYLPDVFLYVLIGSWIDRSVQGYRHMFLYGIVMCCLGGIVTILLLRSIKREKGVPRE